jgi:threonine synthase
MAQQNSKYSSTRYHDYTAQEHFSFEDVVLKGLASDGGLFHPETVPNVRSTYLEWKDLSFQDLAFQVMRLYIDPGEISDRELQSIVHASYSTFRHPSTVPLITLDRSKNLHLLELFHGPTFAFKDVALQFLGNLFEFFLIRKNAHLESGRARHHLTVIGATSGDTGSAAIYGLRGKEDVSIFILFPDGKVSPIQAAQMTTVLDANVHNIAVQGTFDDCQDMVKALFGDAEMNKEHHLAAVNSINWARILAQITYYFYAYFQLLKQEQGMKKQVKFLVPTGNFGNILAGYYAKRMGLPIARLVISTNENDILHRFWQTGTYSKHDAHSEKAHGGFKGDGAQAHEAHVKETPSPAMDILVSSNFERLLWHLRLQYEFDENPERRIEVSVRMAGAKIHEWFLHLKTHGFFTVEPEMLDLATEIFGTYRVSNEETLDTIRQCYRGEVIEKKNYVLDPHSAIGVAASLREIKAHAQDGTHTISLATAHPAKFSTAVETALKDETGFNFDSVLPEQFVGLEKKERRFLKVAKSQGLAEIRRIIIEEVEKEKDDKHNGA